MSMICSVPLPAVVIAKRGEFGVSTACCVVRNMYVVVLLEPKSKTRCQIRAVRTLTQQAMVTAVVAPMVFRLAGTVTKPPLVALADARFTDPVPTRRVVEKVAVPVPIGARVAVRPWPDESLAEVPVVSPKRYQATRST